MADARRTGVAAVELDAALVARLRPDVIIGQAVCDVCAVGEAELGRLVTALMPTPWIVTLHAHTLDGVVADIGKVGEDLELRDEAEELVAGLRYRMRRVRHANAEHPTAPNVLVLEWLKPPYISGHWGPGKEASAGG